MLKYKWLNGGCNKFVFMTDIFTFNIKDNRLSKNKTNMYVYMYVLPSIELTNKLMDIEWSSWGKPTLCDILFTSGFIDVFRH